MLAVVAVAVAGVAVAAVAAAAVVMVAAAAVMVAVGATEVRCLAVAFLIALASPASAGDRIREAREHYDRGNVLYNLAEFDGAITEFKQAYELSGAPKLLFNLAQAYRLKGSREQAAFLYSTYLRLEPRAPNRADVEQRLQELRAEQQRSPPIASMGSAPPPVDVVAAPRSRTALRLGGPIMLAGSAVTLALGAYYLALSVSDGQQLDRITGVGGAWDSQARSLYDDGQRSRIAGLVLVPVGVAGAVGGAIMSYFGYRQVRDVTFGVNRSVGGATASIGGRF
ncbi:MAG: Thiol-disulfide isomerase [Myxococcales bacterium]|nr:Thiol-disulfide isomerase [Myxococcales bacterium]